MIFLERLVGVNIINIHELVFVAKKLLRLIKLWKFEISSWNVIFSYETVNYDIFVPRKLLEYSPVCLNNSVQEPGSLKVTGSHPGAIWRIRQDHYVKKSKKNNLIEPENPVYQKIRFRTGLESVRNRFQIFFAARKRKRETEKNK